jgi:hypothetical protein
MTSVFESVIVEKISNSLACKTIKLWYQIELPTLRRLPYVILTRYSLMICILNAFKKVKKVLKRHTKKR